MALTYTVSRSGDIARLALAGEMDLSVQEQVRRALAALLAPDTPTRVEIDVSGLEFIDSTSIGMLVGARQGARAAGCDLVVTCPRGMVLRVLEITGVLDELSGRDSVTGREYG
jgi:anti-sigma B factor antagonist